MPQVLGRLMATLAREGATFAEVGSLIEKDTVLAAQVLRLVNSPVYGRAGTISSVRHALAILGLDKIRNLAFSLSVSRLYDRTRSPASWPARNFNLHSVAVAVMADLLAMAVGAPGAECAFVAGLLHDIGKLPMAMALLEEYQEIEAVFREGGRSMADCETAVMGTTHCLLASVVLARWNLPAEVSEAVAAHHRPDAAPRSLALLVQAADALVNGRGILLPATSGEAWEEPGGALQSLGVRQPERLLEEFQVEFDAVRAFF